MSINQFIPTQVGETPVFVASYEGNFEVVKYLAENGANINEIENNVRNNRYMIKTQMHNVLLIQNGCSPIKAAASKGYFEIVKYLTEKGAIMNRDVLQKAIRYSHFKVVKYLAENGLDINSEYQVT